MIDDGALHAIHEYHDIPVAHNSYSVQALELESAHLV